MTTTAIAPLRAKRGRRGFGRCWPRAPDVEFRPVRDRRRPGGRDDNRVCPRVLVPPLAQSRLRFGLGFGAPRFHDRRRGFRLPGRAKAMSRARRLSDACAHPHRPAILRLGDKLVCPCVLVAPLAQSPRGFGLGFSAPNLHDRRRGSRLPWTGEGDEPREGAFRTLAPTRTARAILRLGDKRRRRFSEHLVTPTLGGTTLVRTRLLRKTHGSLIDRDSLPVETGTFFGLG